MSDKTMQTDTGNTSAHEVREEHTSEHPDASRSRIEVETVQARRPSRRNIVIIASVALFAMFSIIVLAMWWRSGPDSTEVKVKAALMSMYLRELHNSS